MRKMLKWCKFLAAFAIDFEGITDANELIEDVSRIAYDVELNDIKADDVIEFFKAYGMKTEKN